MPARALLTLTLTPHLPTAARAGGAPLVSYMTRTNSTGGGSPEACDAAEGEWVTVPFTTVYEFYSCEGSEEMRR